MKRPCLDCGALHTNPSRCDLHQRQVRPPTNPAYNDPQYKRIRKQRIREHIAAHGYWCPGLPERGRPPHPSQDLTLDHTIPLSAGGTNHPSNLKDVLCRDCNTAKGGTNRRP